MAQHPVGDRAGARPVPAGRRVDGRLQHGGDAARGLQLRGSPRLVAGDRPAALGVQVLDEHVEVAGDAAAGRGQPGIGGDPGALRQQFGGGRQRPGVVRARLQQRHQVAHGTAAGPLRGDRVRQRAGRAAQPVQGGVQVPGQVEQVALRPAAQLVERRLGDLAEVDQHLAQLLVGVLVGADRQHHERGDHPAGRAERGLLDPQHQHRGAVGVQQGVEQPQHRGDEEGHQRVGQRRGEEHPEHAEQRQAQGRPGVVADQRGQPETGDHTADRADDPPVALDQDLPERGGVDEDDPAGQDRPVPALRGQELAADDGQRRAQRHLEGGAGGRPVQPGRLLLGLLVGLRLAGHRDVLGLQLLTGAGRLGGVVGLVLRPVERQAQTEHRAGRLADGAEALLHGQGGARQVLVLAVGQQPVAQYGDRGAAVVRGPGHQHLEGPQVGAEPAGHVVPRGPALRGGGQRRRVRQVQGEGVGAVVGVGLEQQHAEALGGDLRVGDAALQQGRGGRVAGAVVQPVLDHQGALVEPSGAAPQFVDEPFDALRVVLADQLGLRLDHLGEPGAEGAAQPHQGALRRGAHQGQADRGGAAERHRDRRVQQRERPRRGVHEHRDEEHLEADQAEAGAPVAEPADVDGPEDHRDEHRVLEHPVRRQQRAQGHGHQRHGKPEREGDRLVARLGVADGEGGGHARDGPGDQQLHRHLEGGQHGEGGDDRGDRPQSGHQADQPRVRSHEPVPYAGHGADPRLRCQSHPVPRSPVSVRQQ